jgi:hypothetical protein
MDWFSTWDPVFYAEIDQVDPAVDTGRLTAWLILAVVALAVAALWYRQRVFRHSFWCATIGRDVEVCFRLGRVLSCSNFENPSVQLRTSVCESTRERGGANSTGNDWRETVRSAAVFAFGPPRALCHRRGGA